MTEKQAFCIGAGMTILRENLSFRSATPVLFRDNLRDIPTEEFKVPHSEVAMHTKAAGKEIAAVFISPNVAFIAYVEDDGSCGYTYGSINEMLRPNLARRLISAYFPEELKLGGKMVEVAVEPK